MSMGVAPSAASPIAAEESVRIPPNILSGYILSYFCFLQNEDSKKSFEKTEFSVSLLKYDETQKVKAIKALKSIMTGMNLVQVRHISSDSKNNFLFGN